LIRIYTPLPTTHFFKLAGSTICLGRVLYSSGQRDLSLTQSVIHFYSAVTFVRLLAGHYAKASRGTDIPAILDKDSFCEMPAID